MLRPIIHIDEEKCNGCGQCVLDCAEGALAIIDGKARLISQNYCDGLGACLNCPQDALRLEMAEAPPFDEHAALEAKAKREGKCGGTSPRFLQQLTPLKAMSAENLAAQLPSWPIQLELVPPAAPYLKNADLLLAAHCSGFALPGIQEDFIAGRIPVIACPKIENFEKMLEKLAAILKDNNIKSLTVLRMSVPCCGGLEKLAKTAIAKAGINLSFQTRIVNLG